MRIIVMGDIHADFGPLNQLINKEKPDIILQCGDFGWWPHHHGTDKITKNRRFDQYAINLGDTKLYWCDGNHENHDDLLERMKAAPGQPLEIPVPGCSYMPRGSILALPNGKNVLFFGGAMSTDKHKRVEGKDWWAGELPTQKDLEFAKKQVAAHGGRVDIVISHTAPLLITMQLIGVEPIRRQDPTVFMLNQILEEFQPKEWFFGHFHVHAFGTTVGCQWTCLNAEGFGGGWWVELSDF